MNSSKDSILFSPLTIRGVTFKNRIGVSPMGMCSCEDGSLNDFHLVHYGSLATGGAGLVIVEATSVEKRGRVTQGCSGLWKDQQIEPLRRVVTFLKSQGVVPGIQLSHAGRKGGTLSPWESRSGKSIAEEDGGWATISASAVDFKDLLQKTPKVATLLDIEEIKNSWISAAKRALDAGFELIELHFAHGYLISSFLSPITNLRTDKYGGSLENRMRFGLEIAESVRKVLPENVVIGARISVTDYVDNGWDVSHTIEFAKRLKNIGLDFIDCSSGGVVPFVPYDCLNTHEVQVRAAATIQKEAGIATAAVGKIIDPFVAENILKEKGATLVLLGRALLNSPHWPYMAADALADETSFKFPIQYDWCIGWKSLNNWRSAVLKNQNQQPA